MKKLLTMAAVCLMTAIAAVGRDAGRMRAAAIWKGKHAHARR